ncbi:universal stress protein [Azoarcus olearius]|uniref:Universal stress protein family n=1 Tax=Azoarcus sp. (strain BH72) TaxID=418699 RepID=A1KAA9_AZOSB|nr:universal stress protein [Azoarcus olearius]CAL95765.1 universal stress protein family [Azoarcus olearius]
MTPQPIPHLLAATDLSAPARHAVARAALLSAETGAPLGLLHVVSLGALDALRGLLTSDADAVTTRLLDEARDEVGRLAAELAERYGAAPETHLAVGAVVPEIAACADACDAGLLVMGVRGAGFMRDLLVGSTTDRVLRKLTRPLLAVRQIPHEPYRRVLVPVDFSPRSLAALQLARRVAPRADLVLLHAFEVPFEGKLRLAGVEDETLHSLRVAAKRHAVERLNALITAAGLEDAGVRRIVLHADPTTLILEQEQEQDCDLIVIGKHGQSALEDMLLGSVTKHVLARASADVLVADRTPV